MAGTACTAGCRCGLFRLLRRAAALEVGGIPATAAQLEIRRRHLLMEGLLPALRTYSGTGFAHLAHELGLVTATGALIIVNRHRNYPLKNEIITECKITKICSLQSALSSRQSCLHDQPILRHASATMLRKYGRVHYNDYHYRTTRTQPQLLPLITLKDHHAI